MLKIIRLIRVRTVAFAILCMTVERCQVIAPVLDGYGLSLQMSRLHFALLVTAVCCLVAGAYVINDYFDTKSDRISKVRNVVVGASVSRRTAIVLHTCFNVVAVSLALYLGLAGEMWQSSLIFLGVSVLLWLYSGLFKKFFLAGNLLAALLAALIPLSVMAFELPLTERAGVILPAGAVAEILSRTFCLAWPVFLNVLAYEVNKDCFTVEGDREDGIATIAVRSGLRKARLTVGFLVLVLVLSAVAGCLADGLRTGPAVYTALCVILPAGLYLYAVNGRKDDRRMQLGLVRLLTVLSLGAAVLY